MHTHTGTCFHTGIQACHWVGWHGENMVIPVCLLIGTSVSGRNRMNYRHTQKATKISSPFDTYRRQLLLGFSV